MVNKWSVMLLSLLLSLACVIMVSAKVSDNEFKDRQQMFNDGYSKAQNAGERDVAIRKLGETDHPGVVKTLVDKAIPRELKENEPLVLDIIAVTLGRLTDADAIKELVSSTKKTQPPGKIVLIKALSKVNTPEAQAVLLEFVSSSDSLTKIAAIDALADANPPEALDKVIDALNNKYWEVRASAINYLSRVKDDAGKQKAIDALQKRRGEEKGRMVTDITEAISKISQTAPTSAADDKDKNMTVAFFDIKIDSDVIFVVDLSLSMKMGHVKDGATRIEALQRELKNTVEMMAKSRKPLRFNIIAYSDKVQRWQENLVPISEYKDKAIKWIDELKLGDYTNIYDALEMALTGASTQKAISTSGTLSPYTICLMSDGTPNRGKYKVRDEILAAIRTLNQTRKIKINTVALGALTNEGEMLTPDAQLLRQLAEENGGVYKEF
ncbi:MAG: HEAT repeat domain-containing protein [Planctomycetes bacterium]|nr:HEAT repeat domain-containing protein [Planctomycetota bacterium]